VRDPVVFVSYASENGRIAHAACEALEAAELACWIAPRDIVPGKLWSETIVEAIERCRMMVVVVSSASNVSDQVLREVTIAAEQRLAILPFRTEDVSPRGAFAYYFNAQHWLDGFREPLATHLDELVHAVQRSIAGSANDTSRSHEPVATVPPPPADVIPDEWRRRPHSRRRWFASIFEDR
jgi:hypothetical protein